MLRKIGEMRKGFILLVVGIVSLAVCVPVFSEEPKVSVEIDKDQVVLGDSLRLTITVEGETPKSPPELPQIADFDVRYLGSRTESFSSFTIVIQGQKKEERHSGGGTQFEYALIPKKLGSFTIPRFSFTIDGLPYHTSEAYSIVVTDLPESSENIFLKVSADKETVYLGESVLVTFEWYFDKDVQDYSLTIPWYGGLKEFLVEDPKPDQSKQYAQLIVNDKERVAAEKKGAIFQGKRYTVLSFQKILTPISAGTYTLEPSFVRAEVVEGYEERQMKRVPFFRYYSDFEDLFGGLGRKPVTEQALTRSRPLSLTVKPLPEQNKPATFTGAVGSFDFQVSVTPESVQKGEPVTVAMKVVGAGNFSEVQLPDFPELSAFKGYTPEIKSDTSRTDSMAIGEKTFTKVLVGRREGKYEIPPLLFSFFDPEKGMYQTIARGPFPIEVKPGTSQEEPPQLTTEPTPARRGKEVKVITQDIRYIKDALGVRRHFTTPLYKMPLFWFFGFVPLPLLTAASFLLQRRRQRFQTDIAYARRTQAFRNAEKMLASSVQHLKEGNAGEFYSTLSRVVTRFLTDKLNRPPGTLPQELIEALQAQKVDAEIVNDLKNFFDRIDLVKYSRAAGDSEETNAMSEKVKRFLAHLEKRIR